MPLERLHIPRDCRLNAAGMPPDAAGTSLEAPRMSPECRRNAAVMPFSYATIFLCRRIFFSNERSGTPRTSMV